MNWLNWLNSNKKSLIYFAFALLSFLVAIRSGLLSVESITLLAEFPIWLTVLGFIVVYAIMGMTMAIPKTMLFIAAGIAFPAWIGILVTYVGLATSASIGHLMGRKMGEEKVTKILAKQKKASNFLIGNKENLLSLCFISRVLPMPFALTSLFFGALKVPYLKFVFVSLLGATPYMIPVIFAGAAITDPFSAAFLVPFSISFGITIVIFVAYKTKIVTKTSVTVFLLIAQVYLFGSLLNRIVYYIPAIAILIYVVSIFLVLHLVKQDKTAAYKVIWIVIIMVLPLAGGILYLLFGNNRTTKKLDAHIKEQAIITNYLDSDDVPAYEQISDNGRADLMRYIQRASSYHPYENTDSTYYPMGELMFENMLYELKRAEKFILMEYFIISKGQMWDGIVEILLQKAEKGVDVRLIFDDVGSFGLFNAAYVSNLRSKGIKIMRFNPVMPYISPFMNNRNHRKIMVIDGHTAFNGGINIGDEYINLKNHLGVWKDTGVRLKGDAVWSFTLMFIETWNAFCKEKDERIADYMAYKGSASNEDLIHDGMIIPYADSPLGDERLGENIYIDILAQAKRYVYIFSPYLIISDKMIYAMQMAAKRGVDVRVVTPGIPDKKIVYRLSRSYYKYLLDAGVKVYEYTPGFLHAKSFVCDDEIAIVGTINLDYRSLYLHFECATLLYRTSTVEDVKTDAIKTISESREVLSEKKQFYDEFLDSILHLFAPLM